jgi:NDP-sugar pyrophosphorylase family protein
MLPVAILAGGLATRLRPLTETIPKALIEVAGEPFIAHQLRLLRRNGIRRAVLCTGYLGEMLRSYVGSGERFHMDVQYSPDGPILLGTGGALRNALPLLGDAFLVLYGDSYLPCNYADVQAAFTRSGKLGLMTVFRNEGSWDASNVEFTEGRLLAYDKQNRTGGMRHIDYGLGALRASALAAVPPGTCYDLALVYRDLLRAGDLAAYEVTERFYEVGSHEGIRDLTEYLKTV